MGAFEAFRVPFPTVQGPERPIAPYDFKKTAKRRGLLLLSLPSERRLTLRFQETVFLGPIPESLGPLPASIRFLSDRPGHHSDPVCFLWAGPSWTDR